MERRGIVFTSRPRAPCGNWRGLYRIIKPRRSRADGMKGDGNRDGVMQKYAEFSPKVAGEVCSVDFWPVASRGSGGDGDHGARAPGRHVDLTVENCTYLSKPLTSECAR